MTDQARPRRTRYTCPESGGRVVKSVHPNGGRLHCPLCGREVIVTAAGTLPTHNYLTKAERARLRHEAVSQ